MARVDDLLADALRRLPPKPGDDAPQAEKKRYSELVSQVAAEAFAEELRRRGLRETTPNPAASDGTGAERRMAGGIGAKKVDVTWATPESGLLLAVSVKTINFRDKKTGNYQKNLTNRRGDLLIEAVTLHRRFPYAVLGGFFFLDHGAEVDGTERRRSTFDNANHRLRMFTGRDDPAGRDEQFERLFLVLLDADQNPPSVRVHPVGNSQPVALGAAFDDLVALVAQRNHDFYEDVDGELRTS
ncbi:MAG: hypothetical protein AAF682_26650 [Planctomycetota bacterium]